jgi:hypothetical protein
MQITTSSDLIFVPREEYALLSDMIERAVGSATRKTSNGRSAWEQLVDAGVLSAALPEAEGGFGDARAVSVIAEMLGRHGIVSPFIPCSAVVTRALSRVDDPSGSIEMRQRIAGGEIVATLPIIPHLSAIVATLAGDSNAGVPAFSLSGRAQLVPFGAEAGVILIEALLSPPGQTSEPAVFLIDKGDVKIENSVIGIDGFPYADVVLNGAAATTGRLLCQGDRASDLMEWCRDAYLTALCADALGAMSRLVAITGDYLKVRYQFGEPLASYQALRHRFVDMDIAVTQTRTVAEMAAGVLDDNDANPRRHAVTTAHYMTVRAAFQVSQEAVQLHGAIGMAEETPVGGYFKRLLAISLLFGDEDSALSRYTAGAGM